MAFNFNFNKTGTNSFGSFGQQQKPQEHQKPRFQVTEQMQLSDLPAEESNDFISVFQSISENSAIKPLTPSDSIESDIEQLTQQTKAAILGPLTSLAHQVDYGKHILDEFKRVLDTSRSDFGNKSQARSLPTPFIKRYVQRVHQESQDFSEALASYKSKMEATQLNNSTQSVYDFLEQQQLAILRVSSHIAKIRDQTNSIRAELSSKLKINPYQLMASNDSTEIETTISRDVLNHYKAYLNDEKRKADERLLHTDLFGTNTAAPPPKPASGGFGNFGNSNWNQSNTGKKPGEQKKTK